MAVGHVWVELVGDLVMARVRGEPTEELLRDAQEKVLFLVRDAGRGKVLYDTLDGPATGGRSVGTAAVPRLVRARDHRCHACSATASAPPGPRT
jgi:hypothetical protein